MMRVISYVGILFFLTIHFSTHSINNENNVGRKLKILMLTTKFPVLSETFIVNQIIGLLDRGHDVSVYSPMSPEKNILNTDVFKYKILDHTYFQELPPDLETYDVIVGQFGNLGLDALRLKNKNKNIRAKLVTFFRGYDISSFIKKNPNVYKHLFKKGDLFLAECNFFRKRLIALGANPALTKVHYSAVQLSRFKYSTHPIDKNGTIKVITVSRLVEKKGIEDALMAMQKIMQRYPNVHYTIIGSGELKTKLVQLAKDLGIVDRVTFTGSKTPEEVAQYLNDSHFFILPCVIASDDNIDGVPTVLKEAMACGLPVISTFVSGIPEVVEDGKSGYLVEQHDVKALSEKIAYLIEHPEIWSTMGRSGRKFIEEKCDINMLNDELERLLREVAKR